MLTMNSFTLKLRWLQHGTFDTQHGQYEWLHKPDMDTSRRRFFL
jgi:ribosome production factor 1